MAYKLGTKLTGYYAARDPVSGEYLEAAGWSYSDNDPWKVRNASYRKDICRLSSRLVKAEELLAGLPDYWQSRIDDQLFRKSDPDWQKPYLQDEIDYNVRTLQGLQARKPQLVLIKISTTVTEEPV